MNENKTIDERIEELFSGTIKIAGAPLEKQAEAAEALIKLWQLDIIDGRAIEDFLNERAKK